MSAIEQATSDVANVEADSGDLPRRSDTNPAALGLIAYAAPVGATIFLWMPTVSILPSLYAKYFGLPLTAIGAVLLVTRLIDGITDPGIGYLADRHRATGGSYKTWVAAGGLCLVVASYFLFSPPNPVSQGYYLAWSLVFYIAWTVIDIPHAAWGSSLSADYFGRARVYGFRTTAIFSGLIVFFSIPLLPIFASSEYTTETMRWTVYVGAVVMLICLTTMRWAPNGEIMSAISSDSRRDLVHSIVSNKPLLIFLAAYFTGGLGNGMWFGLIFLYLDGYLHLSDKISLIFLLGNIAGMLSMPLWLRLIRRTNKSGTWAAGIGLYIFLLCGCSFTKPGDTWLMSLVLTGGVYVSFACQTMAAQAILGDIADYGHLRYRRNRGATYYALLTLSYKATSGLGAGLALAIAGRFGFSASAIAQNSNGVFGLRLAFIVLPVSFAAVAFGLSLLTPITKHRHEVIRRRIAVRSVRGR
jgi:Na+/melibiose symporter-like transporter